MIWCKTEGNYFNLHKGIDWGYNWRAFSFANKVEVEHTLNCSILKTPNDSFRIFIEKWSGFSCSFKKNIFSACRLIKGWADRRNIYFFRNCRKIKSNSKKFDFTNYFNNCIAFLLTRFGVAVPDLLEVTLVEEFAFEGQIWIFWKNKSKSSGQIIY